MKRLTLHQMESTQGGIFLAILAFVAGLVIGYEIMQQIFE